MTETPKGWKLVPIEPTEAMMQAAINLPGNWPEEAKATWNVMISATPEFPTDHVVGGEKIDFPKILYVCEVCFAGNQESCGNDRDGMSIAPDGRWLCDGCRDDENIDVSTCRSVPELFTAPPATDLLVATGRLSRGLPDILRETTQGIASLASVDMEFWDRHANACLKSASRIEMLETALGKIADMIDAEDADLDDAISIARAALASAEVEG